MKLLKNGFFKYTYTFSRNSMKSDNEFIVFIFAGRGSEKLLRQFPPINICLSLYNCPNSFNVSDIISTGRTEAMEVRR